MALYWRDGMNSLLSPDQKDQPLDGIKKPPTLANLADLCEIIFLTPEAHHITNES